MTMISKCHQNLYPAAIKKTLIFFPPTIFPFLWPPSTTTVPWKASACSERAPKPGATAPRPTAATPMKRRRRTCCLASPTRMAWQTRWWTWATFPRHCLHATSMRLRSKRTHTRWGAGGWGGGALPGSRSAAVSSVVWCLFVESSCWMCHRIQDWMPSNEQQVHDVICSAGSRPAQIDAAFCFSWLCVPLVCVWIPLCGTKTKSIHPLWNSYFCNTASRSAVSVALVCVYICSFHVCGGAKCGAYSKSL